jgi:hypothetical protein
MMMVIKHHDPVDNDNIIEDTPQHNMPNIDNRLRGNVLGIV